MRPVVCSGRAASTFVLEAVDSDQQRTPSRLGAEQADMHLAWCDVLLGRASHRAVSGTSVYVEGAPGIIVLAFVAAAVAALTLAPLLLLI